MKGNELAEELHTSAFLRDGSAQEEMQSAGGLVEVWTKDTTPCALQP